MNLRCRNCGALASHHQWSIGDDFVECPDCGRNDIPMPEADR